MLVHSRHSRDGDRRISGSRPYAEFKAVLGCMRTCLILSPPQRKVGKKITKKQTNEQKSQGIVAHYSNPGTRRQRQQEYEAAGPHNDFQDSKDYIERPCLKNTLRDRHPRQEGTLYVHAQRCLVRWFGR